MGRINIELPDELHKKVKLLAISTNTTLLELVKTAIEEKLEREKRRLK